MCSAQQRTSLRRRGGTGLQGRRCQGRKESCLIRSTVLVWSGPGPRRTVPGWNTSSEQCSTLSKMCPQLCGGGRGTHSQRARGCSWFIGCLGGGPRVHNLGRSVDLRSGRSSRTPRLGRTLDAQVLRRRVHRSSLWPMEPAPQPASPDRPLCRHAGQHSVGGCANIAPRLN